MREKLIELLMDMPFGNSTYEQEEQHMESVADYLIDNGVTLHGRDCHWATEQAYKNGYEDGYRYGKDRVMMDIAFPKFLVRQPEPSKDELEAIMQSPVVIRANAETVIPIYPYRWIPVTERMPKYFEHVLLNIPSEKPFNTVHEGYLEKDGAWNIRMYRCDPEDVTHWMPLPEPPKGE